MIFYYRLEGLNLEARGVFARLAILVAKLRCLLLSIAWAQPFD